MFLFLFLKYYFFLAKWVLGWELVGIISSNKGGLIHAFSVATEQGMIKTDSVRNSMNRNRIYFNWDHLDRLSA